MKPHKNVQRDLEEGGLLLMRILFKENLAQEIKRRI